MSTQTVTQSMAETEAEKQARTQAERQAESAHRSHRQGTVAVCRLCQAVAYEPGWYATLVSFAGIGGGPRIELPDGPFLRI